MPNIPVNNEDQMPARIITIMLLALATGCTHSLSQLKSSDSTIQDPSVHLTLSIAEINQLNKVIQDSRRSSELISARMTRRDIPTAATAPSTTPLDGPRQFGLVGDRKLLIKDTVVMVCSPIQIANSLKTFSNALSLFDPVETEQVGDWIRLSQGISTVAGAVLLAIGSGTNTDWAKYSGTTLLGGGGILELLKMTPLFKSTVVQESLIRVEFNRQFATLVRQYIPELGNSSSGAIKDCADLTTEVSAYPSQPTDDTVDTPTINRLKISLERLGLIQDGLVKIGSSAGTIKTEMDGQGLNTEGSKKLKSALQSISESTASTRAGWELDRVIIEKNMKDILTGRPAPQPSPGPSSPGP